MTADMDGETDGSVLAFRPDGLLDFREDANGNRIIAGYTGALLTSLTHTSGAALMAVWMTSAPHRANILAARFTETGVGMARSKTGRTYTAQVFARPRASSTR